ncbi:hypothetical protein WICPIJ_009241 [Wickerhamomyces pijperi]|uniref:Uncharacterized protein n=1 Tax=Wickerhamomyces pijperi TaxID=599730 RepID=A0A9P8PPA2_WICPI|nr:hypothetical protein WICPIJ_009241 [Wickerhamomyces pijperi]
MIGESASLIKGLKTAGKLWSESAGNTDINCSNGLNGSPLLKITLMSFKSWKSWANGAALFLEIPVSVSSEVVVVVVLLALAASNFFLMAAAALRLASLMSSFGCSSSVAVALVSSSFATSSILVLFPALASSSASFCLKVCVFILAKSELVKFTEPTLFPLVSNSKSARTLSLGFWYLLLLASLWSSLAFLVVKILDSWAPSSLSSSSTDSRFSFPSVVR